jgi:hypothetical protein
MFHSARGIVCVPLAYDTTELEKLLNETAAAEAGV